MLFWAHWCKLFWESLPIQLFRYERLLSSAGLFSWAFLRLSLHFLLVCLTTFNTISQFSNNGALGWSSWSSGSATNPKHTMNETQQLSIVHTAPLMLLIQYHNNMQGKMHTHVGIWHMQQFILILTSKLLFFSIYLSFIFPSLSSSPPPTVLLHSVRLISSFTSEPHLNKHNTNHHFQGGMFAPYD